jgi:hypothetical protein
LWLKRLLKNGENAVAVELTGCHYLDQDVMTTIGGLCPNLQYLALQNIMLSKLTNQSWWSQLLPCLRVLDVSHSSQLRSLTVKMPRLAVLDTRHCPLLKECAETSGATFQWLR